MARRNLILATAGTSRTFCMVSLALTLGAIFNGGIISYALYGITLGQVVRYYVKSRADPRYLKSLVAVLWILDTMQQCFLTHALWYYFVVRCYGDPLGYLITVWSLNCVPVLGSLSTFAVTSFLTTVCWRLINRKSGLTLMVPVLGSLVCTLGLRKVSYLPRSWKRVP
ncbi:hypothetical protein OE88DRAFT_1393186 [Heliocybe sulcata]|uniref:Uncharacterized protein n=1 Tax=Heliocybe sulcata TaxID=5364 RepID=A0A5C3N4M7_9AGAM|nr:hypothetical protein OE88DRAFT_1393186 [Heliocybe sulcata]